MNKYIFKAAKFFLPGILFLMIFSSCSFNQKYGYETISVTLPEWPPQGDSELYPELLHWKITIAQNTGISEFTTREKNMNICVQKNCPLSVQCQPVTLLDNSREFCFFNPAGFVYPVSDSFTATWEQGFLAEILCRLYTQMQTNQQAPEAAAYFASTFNWKKAQTYIESKNINPWLCDSNLVLHSIINSTFRASLLSSNCVTPLISDIPELAELSTNPDFKLLSSYIPENTVLKQEGKIILIKKTPRLFLMYKSYGVIINFVNAKNVSIQYIYMPI